MIREHRLFRIAAFACVVSAAVPVSLSAQDTVFPPETTKPFTDDGVLVWQGRAQPSVPRLAGLLAPVLWFSPDEPLLLKGSRLPQRHPCDPDAEDGVVYYQIARIRLRGSPRVTVPEHDDPGFFDKVESFAIRYYFYYERDFGVGRHAHDLEVVEMEAHLGTNVDGGREARLTTVIGFAHGTDWYSNELHVEADTRLPIAILVEEGKHASAPDRNADGTYTPGYDVNRRVNDAWGVRDVIGSGLLTAGAFQASMAKPRRPADRRVPPLLDEEPPASILASYDPHDPALLRYRLRPAADLPACRPDGAEPDRLLRMMRGHRFGREFAAAQYESEFLRDLSEPLTGTGSIFPSMGARWDRGIGGTLQLRGTDLRLLYVVPKINWVKRDVGVEALFTPSAARVQSTYLSIGVAREHLSRPAQPIQVEWNPTVEAGLKFRARLAGKRRVLALGYQFAGVRFGIRFSGFGTVELTRMVVEVGPGVW